MPTIIHTADLHLGWAQYNLQQRLHDFQSAVQRIVDAAVKEDPKDTSVILAGDIFDAVKPPADAVAFIINQLKRLSANMRIYAVQGNHDRDHKGPGWTQVMQSALNNFSALDNGDVYEANGIRIAGWSYNPAEQMLDKLLEWKPKTKVDVVVLHQSLYEANRFSNPVFSVGNVAEAVAPHGVSYVALGDIHTCRHYSHTAKNGSTVKLAYPGSLEMTDCDEPVGKSFLRVTMEPGKSPVIQAVAVPTREYIKASVAAESDFDAALQHIRAADKRTMWLLDVSNQFNGRLPELYDTLSGRLYRISRFTAANTELGISEFDETGAAGVLRMQEVVANLPGEKRALVTALLDGESAADIVKQYMKTH